MSLLYSKHVCRKLHCLCNFVFLCLPQLAKQGIKLVLISRTGEKLELLATELS